MADASPMEPPRCPCRVFVFKEINNFHWNHWFPASEQLVLSASAPPSSPSINQVSSLFLYSVHPIHTYGAPKVHDVHQVSKARPGP